MNCAQALTGVGYDDHPSSFIEILGWAFHWAATPQGENTDFEFTRSIRQTIALPKSIELVFLGSQNESSTRYVLANYAICFTLVLDRNEVLRKYVLQHNPPIFAIAVVSIIWSNFC